jgi:hypothetical protein
VPAALTLKIRQVPDLFSTGIGEVDVMRGGGIPRGSISEVTGTASTGKTSFAFSAVAAITQSGADCAWVDVNDSLSPESAAAANIILKRLLWLRRSAERKQRVTDKPWSRLELAMKAIARQRPGTASGFIFVSGEDETGISNAIIHPKVHGQHRIAVTRGRFLLVEGKLQNQDGVISVKASAVRLLELGLIDMRSHDFH